MESHLKVILEEFRLLCAIPHGSGLEEEIGEHLAKRLVYFGGEVTRDRMGNILGNFPGTDALEKAPITVLQAHMDMVIAGDMTPEEAVVNAIEEDGILHSDGHTTLGADNGIGVATILAILRLREEAHGPIRVIFTVSEEVGLRGAKELSPEWLKDARYMINTDGFHSGVEVIGCKGGLRETFSRDLITEKISERVSFHTRKKNQLEETELYEVKLKGYLGGHSGDDIDKGRCNTISQLAEILRDVQDLFDLRVAMIEGGSGYNVIPSECTAVIAVPNAIKVSVGKLLVKEEHELSHEFEKSDPTGTLTVKWLGEPSRGYSLWDYDLQRDILDFLTGVHDGIETLDSEGNVTSSSNLGQIFTKNDVLYIGDMIRCDTRDQEKKIMDFHESLAKKSGLDISVTGYHSWHSEPDSKLADAINDSYKEMFGADMVRKTAKVGLEPAFFHDMNPHMEIVCLGAEIMDAHSVKERVVIESIGVLYNLISKTLEKLSKENIGKEE